MTRSTSNDSGLGGSTLHKILNVILVLVLAGVVGVNLWYVTNSGSESAAVGKQAPGFTKPTFRGGSYSLQESQGDVVILDFWTTWCPPCKPQLDNLKRLVNRGRKPDGLTVVSVNTNEPGSDRRSKIKQYLQAHESPFTTVLDDGGVSAAYGVSSLPTIVVIGRDGRVVHANAGLHSTQKLRALAFKAAD